MRVKRSYVIPGNAEFSEVPEPGIPPGTPWYLHPTSFEVIAVAFLVFFLILWG